MLKYLASFTMHIMRCNKNCTPQIFMHLLILTLVTVEQDTHHLKPIHRVTWRDVLSSQSGMYMRILPHLQEMTIDTSMLLHILMGAGGTILDCICRCCKYLRKSP